ncbi:hypothetical protein [Bradyrhizobium ivorense]|uniref:hypothetical protein n=1 Tax=Bradyrhizobium ivorense TaxID=2511166 RepID=UPI001FCEDF95|nr:hypothetical protein [Bradyrhizobium ivorense]
MIEQSTDPSHGMMTLKATDGFSVCFSIPRAQQSELGEALRRSRWRRCVCGRIER